MSNFLFPLRQIKPIKKEPSKIINQIHTFGDSHSNFGWDNSILKHYVNSILCYSFGKEPLKRCDIRKYGLKNDDIIIFCFGEIDCRCHIHKHITSENSYKNIIDDIIKNYIAGIKLVTDVSNLRFKYICIYNVLPPITKANTPGSAQYPYLGTDEERKQYVLYFNECLKEKCKDNNWVYFDVYDDYKDVNGFLNKELSDGIVHVKDGKYIRNFIQDNLQ